jgi:hypothetical protein
MVFIEGDTFRMGSDRTLPVKSFPANGYGLCVERPRCHLDGHISFER